MMYLKSCAGEAKSGTKRRKAWITAAVAVICVAALTACGSAAETVDLTGDWVLDGAYTSEANGGLDLRELYGSALSHYGATLRVSADGSIGYYIGVFEGKGTWQEDKESGICTAELIVYPEQTKETLAFYGTQENADGSEHLALDFGEYVLYWVRADAEQ